MKKSIAILIGLIIIAIVAGCSSSKNAGSINTPGKQQTKLLEPEMLISKQEAAQFIGQPVKDAEKKETKSVGMKLCVYNPVKEGTAKFLQVTITQQAFMPANGQTPQSIYESLKNNFKNAVKVDGVGDEAFIAPPGLHMLKNGYYITIAVGNSDDEKNRELLKSVGKKAVDNLERLNQ